MRSEGESVMIVGKRELQSKYLSKSIYWLMMWMGESRFLLIITVYFIIKIFVIKKFIEHFNLLRLCM